MMFIEMKDGRVFLVDEYWVLIPVAVVFTSLSLLIIRSYKAKKAKAKLLKERLERLKKLEKEINIRIRREETLRRILCLSLGLNSYSYILMRGGADYLIDVSYERCRIKNEIGYLDDVMLRNLVTMDYARKMRGKVIYITATAICRLAHDHGLRKLTVAAGWAVVRLVPNIGRILIFNSHSACMKAIMVASIAVAIVHAGVQGGLVPGLWIYASIFLGAAYENIVGPYIATTPVPAYNLITGSPNELRKLEPRVATVPEVVILNRSKGIVMTTEAHKNGSKTDQQACSWGLQELTNPKCRKMKRGQAIDLDYDDVVNMQDITGLPREQFTDSLDLGPTKPKEFVRKDPPQSKKMKMRAKQKNFLQEYGDPKDVPVQDQWETGESGPALPEKESIKTRNEL
jgi:hypothetical protein